MIDLIPSILFIIIPSFLVSISVLDYFQKKLERELYVERKFTYKLALSIITCLPLFTAIFYTCADAKTLKYPYAIIAMFISFSIAVLAMLWYFSSSKWYGTYYISHKKRLFSEKKACIHISSSTNYELVRSQKYFKSKIKKVYQDILFEALTNVDDDTSVVELKSPMLRKTSYKKIQAVLESNPKVERIENCGKSNLFLKYYMWVLMSSLLRKNIKVRDVYTVKIHLVKPIKVSAEAH